MFIESSTCKMERLVALFDVGRHLPMFISTVKHTSVLNDFYFAMRLVNVILFLSKIRFKNCHNLKVEFLLVARLVQEKN